MASLTTHLGPTLINRARNIIGPPLNVNYLQKSDWFSYPLLIPVSQSSSGFRLFLLLSALKANIDAWKQRSNLLATILAFLQDNVWWSLLALSLILALIPWVKGKVLPPPVWRAVHSVLDQLRSLAFEDRANDDPDHYHRVTLFKVINWRITLASWPFSRCLVAVERSRDLTRKSSVSFPIPDDGESAGIAGRTFVMGKSIQVHGLPDVTSRKPKREEIDDYAKKTFVTADWIRMEQPAGRAFLGIVVEVKGSKWGVIVFDSRNPKEFDMQQVSNVYSRFAKVLGKLLEAA